MNIESYRNYCLSFAGVTEETPFDADTLVFKVMGKMFGLTSIENFKFINLKCEPEFAIELRERYESVSPGYHMNKKHWNSILTDGELSDQELKYWIHHSYHLVANSLTKKQKEELEEMRKEL